MSKPRRAIEAFKGSLIARYFLRFHMAILLATTVASGLASSKLLLTAGLTDVRWRYPVALLLSYLVFVGLVRLWISYVTAIRLPVPGLDGVDALPDQIPSFEAPVHFGGGEFGGGGATSSWADAASDVDLPDVSVPDVDLDVDEGGWIILVLVVAVGILFGAGIYLIWIAPELLTDVACQAMLAASLRGRVLQLERSDWSGRLLRRTAVPLAIVTLAVSGLAFAIHWSCPGAAKLSEALACPAN